MARQKLDDIFVEMKGSNAEYTRMLKRAEAQTARTVKKINQELSKIKDVGGNLDGGGRVGGTGTGGRGTGGGTGGRGRSNRPSRGPRRTPARSVGGGRAVGLGSSLGAAERGMAARGGLGSLIGGAAGTALGGPGGGMVGSMIGELALAPGTLGKVTAALGGTTAAFTALGAASAAASSYFIYTFHPATTKVNDQLEITKKNAEAMLKGFDRSMAAQDFERQFSETPLKDLSIDAENASNNFERAQDRLFRLKKELREIEDNPLEKVFNRHAIKLLKADIEATEKTLQPLADRMEDLRKKERVAKHRQEQLEKKEAERKKAVFKDVMGNQITALKRSEIIDEGTKQGKTDREIETELAIFNIRQRMAEQGVELTEAQEKRLRATFEDLNAMEKARDLEAQRTEELEKQRQEQQKRIELVRKEEQQKLEADMQQKRDRITSLVSQNATPMQKLKSEIEEIQNLMHYGLPEDMGQAMINKKIKNAAKGFGMSDNSAGAALIKGTVEAYSKTTFGKHQRGSEQDIKNMLKEAVSTTKILRRIEQNTDEAFFGPPIQAAEI